MRVIVAPDSYKGSISAKDICMAAEKGIKNVIPDAEVLSLPLADGGEGTMENLVFASGGARRSVYVTGPMGEKIEAAYGVMGDKETVIIEMAQASGLPLVREGRKNPMKTTSYGTGELIAHALNAGYRKFIVGLGGSATNDGGLGMLQALGMKFYGKDNDEVTNDGTGLTRLAAYDETGLDSRIKDSTFIIASDVTNKLCGPEGAAAIFGPQKGATPDMVKKLDHGLSRFSDIVEQKTNINMKKLTGGGAAGGMGASMIVFLNAEVRPGISIMMDETNFEEKMKTADLVITGEGKLDGQTLSGKVIKGVCSAAAKHNVPIIALCGMVDLPAAETRRLGLLAAFSIVPGPCSLDVALQEASAWVTDRTESIIHAVEYYKTPHLIKGRE